MKKVNWKCVVYWLIHAIWGFPTFIYGCLIALYMLLTWHKPKIFGYAVYFESNKLKSCGFEAGPFFVVASDSASSLSLKQHEHGHGIQTLWWGPLMLFVISIPSCIRFNWRSFQQYRHTKLLAKKKISVSDYSRWLLTIPLYDSIWFEKQASVLGKRYFKEA